jgi:chromosomal replication initiation ATPase DnaA
MPEPEPKPLIPLSRIRILQQCVATAFDLSPRDVIEPSRHSRRVRARQAGMYLARELLELSLLGIGRKFGVCDHTSALRAYRFTSALMISDMDFREKVETARADFLQRTATTGDE